MALAPAALAELVDAAALLFVLLGWAIALGLLWTWRHTLGLAFEHLADALNFNVGAWGVSIGHVDFGGPIRDFNVFVQNFLSAWASGSDIAAGRLFAGLGWIFQEMAHSAEWAARELFHTSTWLLESYLPAWIKAQLGPILNLEGLVKWAVHHFGQAEAFVRGAFTATLHGIEGSLHWTRTETERLERWSLGIDRQVKELARHAGHAVITDATAPAIGAIPVPIGRTIADLKKLAHKHEGIFAASVFGALMANVLGLSSWRCLSKGPVGRVSRALCGLGGNALNDLLSLLVDAFIFTDICAVMDLLNAATPVMTTAVNGIVDAFEMVTPECSWDAPPVLKLPALQLPPAPGLSLQLV